MKHCWRFSFEENLLLTLCFESLGFSQQISRVRRMEAPPMHSASCQSTIHAVSDLRYRPDFFPSRSRLNCMSNGSTLRLSTPPPTRNLTFPTSPGHTRPLIAQVPFQSHHQGLLFMGILVRVLPGRALSPHPVLSGVLAGVPAGPCRGLL